MNELSTEVNAQEIHERAVGFYKISEQYGYKFLMEVKTIRDEKLYKELGFETFEDYTLHAFNYSRETISKRIKAAEVFGEDNVEALRHLGTQKVNELATMPEEQRTHVIENGIETETGNKSIDEATTRELEKYKKQLKQRDEEKSHLESQLEQAQHSESIARKQLEEVEDREPEVIEKYMEPEDYQELKESNKQLKNYLDEVSNHYKKLNSDIEKLKNERSETDEKSQKYDELNKAINSMNTKLNEGQQKLKAQKEIYDLVKGSEKVIREVAPLCYLAFSKDLIDDLQERAKANQGKRNDLTFSSAEPKVNKAPVHENKEIAEMVGVSPSTVMRAKKVKNENPEAYEEVIKNNGGWDKAFARSFDFITITIVFIFIILKIKRDKSSK